MPNFPTLTKLFNGNLLLRLRFAWIVPFLKGIADTGIHHCLAGSCSSSTFREDSSQR